MLAKLQKVGLRCKVAMPIGNREAHGSTSWSTLHVASLGWHAPVTSHGGWCGALTSQNVRVPQLGLVLLSVGHRARLTCLSFQFWPARIR